MAEKPRKKFEVHVRKRSKTRGWFGFLFLVGPPLVIGAYGYWLQGQELVLLESVRKRDFRAPFAAWSLGRQRKADLVREELQVILLDTSTSPWLRRGAASALGTLHDPLLTVFFTQAALQDPDPSVRAEACAAMGVNGEYNALATLGQVLREEHDPAPVSAACTATGKLQLGELIPLLITRLETSDYRVRTAAREALETFAPEGAAYGDRVDLWQRWYLQR